MLHQMRAPAEIPQGTVTFVFTDIVGSSALWERHPDAMRVAIRRHDTLLREIFEDAGGFVFKTVGDAFCVAFEQPAVAVRAAIEACRRVQKTSWEGITALKIRIGIHAGPAEYRDGDYFGGTLNRVARIQDAAHGGQILVSSVVRDLLQDDSGEAFGFRDLGEHRLKNLERPERLFQALAGELEPEFPPPRSMEVLPNNLPLQTTSFIGREKECAEVIALLEGKARLLTLTGAGGTGKTRLAIEAGARMIGAFRDGVWLVELALVGHASGLLPAVTSALGVREEPGHPLVESLASFLRIRQILIILDNCEQLAGSVASLTIELLRTCPDVKILATSRHSLGVTGEMTLPIPPLGILDTYRESLFGPRLAERVGKYDAVRLFADRAAAARPGFLLTDENAATIAQICSHLDGIPLAIELAAARCRLLDVQQIAERLVDRFKLLRGSRADRLPHQQTLETLIHWSYDLLSDPERILFQRLGIFVGGRNLEAIEAVCSDEAVADVLDLLQQLVEKSLVVVEKGISGPRYTMLESVWHYSRAKLRESGEKDRLADRHLAFFLECAEEAAPHFESHDQKTWFDAFNEDAFNYNAAIRWSIRSGKITEGLRLLAALKRALVVRGYLTDARDLARQVLERAGDAPPTLLADATASAAHIAWAMDLHDEARTLFHKAETLATQAGQETAAAFYHALQGLHAIEHSDKTRQRFEAGLRTSQKTGSLPLRALCLNGLGRLAAHEGRLDEARDLIEEGLQVFRGLGDQWTIGLTLRDAARIAIARGDRSRAEAALCEWASIIESLGNGWLLPSVIETFGYAALGADDNERAAFLLGGAESLRKRLGQHFAADEQNEHDKAVSRLKTSLNSQTLAQQWQAGAETLPQDLLIHARSSHCLTHQTT